MKTKYKLTPFYINGVKESPKDLDFAITPCLVFATVDKTEIDNMGFVYGLALNWGYWAIGIALYKTYLKDNDEKDRQRVV